MHIGLGVDRRVVIDHVLHAEHVNATCRRVRGHEDGHVTPPEPVQVGAALARWQAGGILGHEAGRPGAKGLEEEEEAMGGVDRGGEDDDALGREAVEEGREVGGFLGRLGV